MANPFKKVIEFISAAGFSRTASIIVILIIAAAIPLTVIVSQRQQEIRQRAQFSWGNCSTPGNTRCKPGSPSIIQTCTTSAPWQQSKQFVWEDTRTCGIGYICNDNNTKGIAQCVLSPSPSPSPSPSQNCGNCTSFDRPKCQSGSPSIIQICTDSNGCLMWTSQDCGTGKICQVSSQGNAVCGPPPNPTSGETGGFCYPGLIDCTPPSVCINSQCVAPSATPTISPPPPPGGDCTKYGCDGAKLPVSWPHNALDPHYKGQLTQQGDPYHGACFICNPSCASGYRLPNCTDSFNNLYTESFTFTGLSPNMSYDLYVWTIDNNGLWSSQTVGPTGACIGYYCSPTPTPTVTQPPTATPTLPPPTGGVTISLPPPPSATITTTPAAGGTQFALTVGLDGIGSTGDNTNPQDSRGSNKNPSHTTRNVTVEVFDNTNKLVASKNGTVSYDSASGIFKGTIDMGTGPATGNYIIKVKSDGYLKRQIGGIQNITAGQINNLPPIRLVAGDINGDNIINIADYNIFISCSIFGTDNQSCNQNEKYRVNADLDDNNSIDEFDYDLFLKEFSVQNGD